MSWLRDSVAARGESFGKFCRRVVVHPAWTARSMGARTLENRLRAYEKGRDAWFIEQRPFLFGVFAQLLRLPEHEVRRLDKQHRGLDLGALIALTDVPGATFDPSCGVPPPLFHDHCLEPRRWQQDWWVAPAGSGRSLLGRVLAATGRVATVQELTSADQVERVLAAGAPRYVEIPDAAVAMQVAPDLARCERILVAAPCSPPWEEAPHDFEPGRPRSSPMPRGAWAVLELGWDVERIEGLLGWLGEVTPSGALRASHDDARTTLLRAHDSIAFEPEVAGDVIAAYGILRQVGADAFEAALGGDGDLRIQDLVRRYLEARVALCGDLDEDLGARLRWLAQEQNGATVLFAMAAASLDRPELTFTPASPDQWADSLHRALDDADPLVDDALAVVRALAHVGVLQSVGSGQLALRPRWLIRAVQHRAVAQLLEQPELSSWAWALRLPGAKLAFTTLRQEFLDGRFRSVNAAIELAQRAERLDDAQALGEAMAVVGLVVRALGLAVLQGAEPPLELAREIYRLEMAWRWEAPDLELPGPQVRFAGLAGSGGPAPDDVTGHVTQALIAVWRDHACWLLGVLGLASVLPDAAQLCDDPVLAPFSSTLMTWTDVHRRRMARVAGYLSTLVSTEGLGVVGLDSAVGQLERLLVARAGHSVYVLAGGHPHERPFVHPLFWNATFVSIAARGQARPAIAVLELLALSEVDLYPPLDTVLREAAGMGVDASRIVTSLLRLWWRVHPDDAPTMIGRRLAQGELAFISHLTEENLDGKLGDALLRARRFERGVHAALDVEQWTALIERASAQDVPVDWSELCERIPLAVLSVLLGRGLVESSGLAGGGVLWRRFPFELVRWCRQELEAGVPLEGLLPVLTAAPPARLAQVAPAIRERLSSMGPFHQALRGLTRIVLFAVDRRPDGWVELQALLMMLVELSGRGAREVSARSAARLGASELPSPLPLGRVVAAESGREVSVVLARPGTEDRGVVIAASETGFSPLGARLRMEAAVGEDHALVPLVEAMRASELGPLVCAVPMIPWLGTKPLVVVQTDRGPWFEGVFPGGLRPWSAELTEHYQRMFLAALAIAGGLERQESAVTVAHPVGHGWPLGLVDAMVAGLGEAASGDGWIPDEVLIDGCCVRRDGAAFVRALERAGVDRAKTAFSLEAVPWSKLGTELSEQLAGIELFRVREA